MNGIKKPRPGAIRIPANAPLTKQSAEVMRVWVTHQAGSTVFIDAGLLADPHMFGHLIADTVRHAAKAYAGTNDMAEDAALQRIVDGLGEELREQFNSITPMQGSTN
ncbi:hypothetical protein GGQ80_001212 [Sphingomonas jinjuensis]|uniref:DUF5076 domain-containing protein n=1 Tax=Sphingomonas jinjuensis TaxID=535907 RepID=A0A840F5X4_9SPHN|nr:hypothetical protein [Sphingomonas jinjuensis]